MRQKSLLLLTYFWHPWKTCKDTLLVFRNGNTHLPKVWQANTLGLACIVLPPDQNEMIQIVANQLQKLLVGCKVPYLPPAIG